jgi:AcrR family transcriptional regulator
MPRRANIRPEEPGRGRIVTAARELFAERGYDGTSIAEIGDRAGISKSILYHHFGSKADLYEAILEAETQDLVQRVAGVVPSDPKAARLRAGVDSYLSFLESRRPTWRLLLRDPPADRELRAVHARVSGELTKSLSKLLATPSKRVASPAQVELVATAIRSFATWWYDHPEVPREEVTAAITDLASAGARRIKSTGSQPPGRT